MKRQMALFLSTLATISLVGCGHQPQMLSPLSLQQAAIQTPIQAQNFSTQYWLGHVLSSDFRPDQNGQQFGFDYVTLNYTSYMEPENQQRLTIAYSVHSSNRYVRFDLYNHVGTPQEKRVPLSQTDTEKLKELNFFLATLMASHPEDKSNLQRILNKLAEVLGQNPRHPQQAGGGLQTARHF